MRRILSLTIALSVGVAGTAAAQAPVYPPPGNPKVQVKPKGPFKTLRVSKTGKYKTIGAAVAAAKAGDTVRVANGTYRESVTVRGSEKRYLKIVGNVKDPAKVMLEGKDLKGAAAQNGILVQGADEVTITGIASQHYKANGFFLVNVHGYKVSHVRAMQVGTYGVYAFNSVGGSITDSVAAWNNDSGFYIGQTPPQVKPIRTIVRRVTSYGNVLGFSGTNMRYTTITDSQWFNNGAGIVPNALSSEKYAPPEENVITHNDVFWNNFNYYEGAPFPVKKNAADSTPYPIGVGILLFGSRTTRVSGNRIYGNHLAGAGMIKQILLTKVPGAQELIGNSFTGNAFGLGGTDLNGRDLAYDGTGQDNCFADNTGIALTVPAAPDAFAACPFKGANAIDAAAQASILQWAVADDHEANMITHPHATKRGLVPLTRYASYTGRKAPK